MRVLGIFSLAVLLCISAARGQQSNAPASAAKEGNPVLLHRPAPQPQTLLIPEGHVKLDVVVTDAAGKPVMGLEPWDFKLLDNGQPSKILSFRYFDGVVVKPDPPVQVILVIDMVNLPFLQVAFVKSELERFLRARGGRLAQPVTLISLTDTSMRILPQPSLDGNGLANLVEHLQGSIRTISSAQGTDGLLERAEYSARQMEAIAENEALRPGRKLLIWVGWGWPILDRHKDNYSERDQQNTFDAIVELSTRLREARMAVYSVTPQDSTAGSSVMYTTLYQAFLDGVKTAQQADLGNLALKVLVTQTGGLILGPDNDVAGQINRCVADANAFYRISFDPLRAQHPDEYHDLKLVVDKPGLTVRTNTGYYNQPQGN